MATRFNVSYLVYLGSLVQFASDLAVDLADNEPVEKQAVDVVRDLLKDGLPVVAAHNPKLAMALTRLAANLQKTLDDFLTDSKT